MSSDGTNYLNDTSAFARELDFITIMVSPNFQAYSSIYYSPTFITLTCFCQAYDVYGPSFSKLAGPNAPLSEACSEPNFRYSAAQAIRQWISTGTPAHKLLLGLPAYGYGYTTLSNNLSATTLSGKPNLTSLFFQPTDSVVPPAGQTADPGGEKDACGNKTVAGGQWLFKELSQTGKLSTDGHSGLGGYQRHYDNCTHTVSHLRLRD